MIEADPAVDRRNQCFLRNMRALWRADAHLALRVDAVDDHRRPALEPTRSGHWTAKVARPDGRTIYLHSRMDPTAEAEQLAAAAATENIFCIVVCGLGLGYHVRALLDRIAPEAFVLCVEPSLEILSAGLCCVDLSDAIAEQKLLFIVDADKARLHEQLRSRGTLMMLGTDFLRHAPSIALHEKTFAALTRLITDFVDFTRMSLLTLVGNAKTTCRNVAMNLVHYVAAIPVDRLRNRFDKFPAVIVSAGPSLRRNIDQLASLKGRAVLIAVQTAVQPLLARGIQPDIITTLDFHEVSRHFFDGVEGLRDTLLVAEPKATWHVLDHYPGPLAVLGNAWAQLLLGPGAPPRDELPSGATVAHLAFYLARYMGCDPIVFTGQDLAFTGHVFYVPGVEIHQTWRSEINRFCPMEQKEWERIARNRPILRRVPGIDGGELYSDELLFTYLEQFEKDIAVTPASVINATEGGAAIRGTVSMPLAAAAERFAQREIDPAALASLTERREADLPALDHAAEQLRLRLAELDEAERVCDELLALLRELDGLTGDPDRFNRRLARVDELRTRVAQDSRVYRVINAATQLAELRRYSADRRIDERDPDEAARAKRQIARDLEFIAAVREGADEVRPMLQAARERILARTTRPVPA